MSADYVAESAETLAEEAWIEYRNDIQRRTPWESHRRVMRRLRKREFVAGYAAALIASGDVRPADEVRAEAWDEGANAATADYGIGEAQNPYRAALAEEGGDRG